METKKIMETKSNESQEKKWKGSSKTWYDYFMLFMLVVFLALFVLILIKGV